MANLYTNPIYTTAQDVIDTTNIAALQALPVADIEELITKAQDAIDAYLQCIYLPSFEDPQDYLFPVDIDGVSTIPLDIQKVTIMVVENIYLLGTPTVAQVTGGQITSEKQGPRAVTYGDQNNSFDGSLIPTNAEVLLDKYKIYSFRQLDGYNGSVYG